MVKHILQQHRAKVITSADNEDVQHIRVRRSHIFSDALRQYSRESFDCSKFLRIRFIGEAAVDDGGPRREFFHLLLQEMFKSSYFAGFPKHVVPVHTKGRQFKGLSTGMFILTIPTRSSYSST